MTSTTDNAPTTTTTNMMKAATVAYKTGVVRIENVPKPKWPADTSKNKNKNENQNDTSVLIQVHYSAIDTATDEVIQKTLVGSFLHARTNPLVLGWHYAGTVVEVGKNVRDDLHVNDNVFGFLQYEPKQSQGSLAEFICVTDDECAKIPQGVSMATAAASATEALTALQAIRDYGQFQKEMSVLVVGAGGGVGSAAINIAHRLEASRVTAICSTKDVDRITKYGCTTNIVDRKKVENVVQELRNSDTRYNVAFDTANVHSAWQLRKVMQKGSCYVQTIPNVSMMWGKMFSWLTGVSTKFVECKSKRADLELIGEWLADGMPGVEIDCTVPIKDLSQALERGRDKTKQGRVLVQVKDGWE